MKNTSCLKPVEGDRRDGWNIPENVPVGIFLTSRSNGKSKDNFFNPYTTITTFIMS